MNKWCKKEIDELLSLIASTRNDQEVYFLLDLILTPREINDMARRLKVLKMLEDGKSYSDIVCEIGISRHTISRVSEKIGFGFRRSKSSFGRKQEKQKIRFKIVRSRVKYKGVQTYKITKIET